MRVLPVTVLTGFLGAGKTTLLRNLLAGSHGSRIALILNELGQAGIDDTPADRTSMVELTEGCVCCLRNPDLLLALEELHARDDVDRVVIETTGLADPLSLTWTLSRPELRGKVRLDAVVTVVDPLNHRLAAREEWEAQVRCGDLVVLSKVDLASAEAIRGAVEAVRAHNARARIVEGGDGLHPGILLDGLEESGARLRSDEAPSANHSDFAVVSLSGRRAYRLDDLEDWLESLPEAVFRAKGLVRTETGGWASFHVVGGRLQIDARAEAPSHGESRIVFFGRGLEREAIEERVASFVHAEG